MCCGSNRSAIRNASTSMRARSPSPQAQQLASASARVQAPPPPKPAVTPQPVWTPGSLAWVTLKYSETAAIRVRGPASGRRYEFSGARPALAIDPRDVPEMLRSGLFHRA
jgi:hypothetical protein